MYYSAFWCQSSSIFDQSNQWTLLNILCILRFCKYRVYFYNIIEKKKDGEPESILFYWHVYYLKDPEIQFYGQQTLCIKLITLYEYIWMPNVFLLLLKFLSHTMKINYWTLCLSLAMSRLCQHNWNFSTYQFVQEQMMALFTSQSLLKFEALDVHCDVGYTDFRLKAMDAALSVFSKICTSSCECHHNDNVKFLCSCV